MTETGKYFWRPTNRNADTKFPWESDALIDANYFRGDNEYPPKSFQREHSYTNEVFQGIMQDGMAVRSTDAWGAENLTPWGTPEGDYSDPDRITTDEWEAAEGNEIDPNVDEWHYIEGYGRKKKMTKKDYRREEIEEDDAAWKFLQRLGFEPEKIWDGNALLNGMIYVAKLYKKEGLDALIRLYSDNIDKVNTGEKTWYPENQNQFVVEFCKALSRRKICRDNPGAKVVSYQLVSRNSANRIPIFWYQLRTPEMECLGEAIWGKDYQKNFNEWNFARKVGVETAKRARKKAEKEQTDEIVKTVPITENETSESDNHEAPAPTLKETKEDLVEVTLNLSVEKNLSKEIMKRDGVPFRWEKDGFKYFATPVENSDELEVLKKHVAGNRKMLFVQFDGAVQVLKKDRKTGEISLETVDVIVDEVAPAVKSDPTKAVMTEIAEKPEPEIYTVQTLLVCVGDEADYLVRDVVYAPLFAGKSPYEVLDCLNLEDDKVMAVKMDGDISIYRVVKGELGLMGSGRTLTAEEFKGLSAQD